MTRPPARLPPLLAQSKAFRSLATEAWPCVCSTHFFEALPAVALAPSPDARCVPVNRTHNGVRSEDSLSERGQTIMELSSIIEVIRIKQEIREEMVALEHAVIQSPDNARQIGASFIGDDDREVFLVIMLNTKNRVIGVHRAHVGSVNSSVVHPREIFKCAILNNASCIIACHQHPSGDPSPSREDILVSERLHEAGDLIGIPVLDHLILGSDESYVSMKQRGYMG